MITIDDLHIRFPNISRGEAKQLAQEVSQYLSENLNYNGANLQLGDLNLKINLSSDLRHGVAARSIGDQILNNISEKIVQNQNGTNIT